MPRLTTCTSHCGQCGRHFHSVKTFDSHHVKDKTGWPQCVDPLDLPEIAPARELVALTRIGECRMYAQLERDVTIWTRPQSDVGAAWMGALRSIQAT